ncbi:MAG: sugar kinase, partial [Acidobacteriota bacterium]
MGILVVGSVALDSIKTPFEARDDILGGSATYFSIAASYFTDVCMVAVIGEDYPDAYIDFFSKKGIETAG